MRYLYTEHGTASVGIYFATMHVLHGNGVVAAVLTVTTAIAITTDTAANTTITVDTAANTAATLIGNVDAVVTAAAVRSRISCVSAMVGTTVVTRHCVR